MKYYIYRDPTLNKIGCTIDPVLRMEVQQGLKPFADFVIAEETDEIIASHLEAYYKGFHKAKWDGDIYMNLNKIKMEQIFKKSVAAKYFSVTWLYKNNLLDTIKNGVEFLDGNESIKFAGNEANDVLSIAQTSFKTSGIYFVPRAVLNLRAELDMHKEAIVTIDDPKSSIKEFDQIREWAANKGLYEKGDPKTQYVKLQEEAGELAKALLKNDEPEIEDGLGDILVVLINLSHLCGYKLEDCLETAYQVINKRTGKMIDGTFVKD